MKIAKVSFFLLLLIAFVWAFYRFSADKEILRGEVYKLRETADLLKKENASLTDKIEYLKNPENLIKELRAQLNYKKEGENMVIVIPKKATSTAP
jgi:cell division protein FtsB